ncbi:hypothetical protein JDBV08_00700 [Mycobacterium phage jiawei]|nr:hypothetical protein JDBV08_00700 [Mycobacterium phage jiawei]
MNKNSGPTGRVYARLRLPAGSATAFSTLATVMHVLGQAVPPRTAIRQLEALFIVSYANAMGRSVTLRDVIEQIGEDGESDARAVERSFHLFTQPNKFYPEALDWIAHEVDPDDRRKKYLVLTPKGLEALSDLAEGFQASIQE